MTVADVDRESFTISDDTLVLAEVSSAVELELLRRWLAEQRAAHPNTNVEVLRVPRADNLPDHVLDRLTKRLDVEENRSVVPVRVFWLPSEQAPSRPRKLAGLLAGRDPYRPSAARQRRILDDDPSRAQIVAGEPATVATLRQLWQEKTISDDQRDFARFVARRAILAIERVEYRLLGPEYKSPRLVKPEMLASAEFRAGLDQIPGATVDAAGKILDELATGWSRLSVDLIPTMGRYTFQRGFDPIIDYDVDQIEPMRQGLERYPAVLLWSHRSNLDNLVLTVAMRENRLPRANLFAGINMAFGIFGSIFRRAGVIYIRRSIGDDPLYKYVLREYVGYVVEKRFNLSWSIEGTRSRTGKMLPPKLGLLSYVADAYYKGRTEDILLQPVSIHFDQLHEISEYADYASGAEKKPEGLGWLIGFVKAQGERHYGKIYVRFPPAVSMREMLGPVSSAGEVDPAARRLALQKLAFEVAWRINQATPVSATALVSTMLLAASGAALTLDQLHAAVQDPLDYLERKKLPTTASALGLRKPVGVQAALDSLSHGGPVTRIAGGPETVWRIAPGDQLAAAFYRNSLVHVFLESAIGELALMRAAVAETDRLEAFWAEAMRLRDLLKFEFYFADGQQFRQHLTDEMSWHDPEWETRIADGAAGIEKLMSGMYPLMSPIVLRPFFEAYYLVAKVIDEADTDLDQKELNRLALGLGKQYVAQRRIRSSESVSTLLFATARQVAVDQKLLEAEGADIDVRRHEFVQELRTIIARMDDIETLAISRVRALADRRDPIAGDPDRR